MPRSPHQVVEEDETRSSWRRILGARSRAAARGTIPSIHLVALGPISRGWDSHPAFVRGARPIWQAGGLRAQLPAQVVVSTPRKSAPPRPHGWYSTARWPLVPREHRLAIGFFGLCAYLTENGDFWYSLV